jgi:superfamily I DNA and/or RNA helicase
MTVMQKGKQNTVKVVIYRFKGKKNIVVNTVDGFQGQEKDIIIVSCVRQNVNKNIGFMDTTQRLNVALTRARECLYVCGHLNTLRFSDAWKSLIQDAVARQVVSSVSSLYQVDLLYEILQRPSD